MTDPDDHNDHEFTVAVLIAVAVGAAIGWLIARNG